MALASEWPTGEGQVKSGGRETTHPSCAPVTWQVLCQGGAGHTAGPAPMAPVANHAASPTSGRASVRDPSGDRGGPAVVCEPRGALSAPLRSVHGGRGAGDREGPHCAFPVCSATGFISNVTKAVLSLRIGKYALHYIPFFFKHINLLFHIVFIFSISLMLPGK